MKSRTTWILLALALIVGGLVYWDHQKGVTTEDAAKKSKRLLDLKSDDVTKLELVRSNETVVAEKANDRWQLKQPLAYRASGSTVSSILSDLETAETERVLSEKDLQGVNLAQFGLDQPRIRVKLATRKGTVGLVLGRETPTKEAVYVQVEGRKLVAIVRKGIADKLATPLGELRDHDVLDTVAGTVTRLEIKSADRLLELVKSATVSNAEARWAIIKPQPLRADQRKVGDLVSDLTGVRVADFISDDAKDVHTYRLDEPVREVTGYVGDKSKTLQFGPSPTNDATKVYARLKGTDTIFTVSADTAKKFVVQPNDLRDARVLDFVEADVKEIEVQSGAGKLQLVRGSNDTWNVTSPVAIAADETKVRDTLTKLQELAAVQFVADVATDPAKYGLAAPAVTVTLRRTSTNVVAQLLVGSADASNAVRHVQRAGEPFVYGVATNISEWLPADMLAVRTKLVAELKTNEVTKITVEKAGKQTVVARDKDAKWTMVEPKEGVLDTDALNQLLESLTQVRAEEFATAKVDKPIVKLTLDVAGKTYVLRVGGDATAGNKYVAWGEPPVVFTMPAYGLTAWQRDLVTPPLAKTNLPPAVTTTNQPTGSTKP